CFIAVLVSLGASTDDGNGGFHGLIPASGKRGEPNILVAAGQTKKQRNPFPVHAVRARAGKRVSSPFGSVSGRPNQQAWPQRSVRRAVRTRHSSRESRRKLLGDAPGLPWEQRSPGEPCHPEFPPP